MPNEIQWIFWRVGLDYLEWEASVKELTPKQLAILKFIKAFIATFSYPPSLQQIGENTGAPNLNGIRQHLQLIEKKGYIKIIPRIHRGIRVLEV